MQTYTNPNIDPNHVDPSRLPSLHQSCSITIKRLHAENAKLRVSCLEAARKIKRLSKENEHMSIEMKKCFKERENSQQLLKTYIKMINENQIVYQDLVKNHEQLSKNYNDSLHEINLLKSLNEKQSVDNLNEINKLKSNFQKAMHLLNLKNEKDVPKENPKVKIEKTDCSDTLNPNPKPMRLHRRPSWYARKRLQYTLPDFGKINHKDNKSFSKDDINFEEKDKNISHQTLDKEHQYLECYQEISQYASSYFCPTSAKCIFSVKAHDDLIHSICILKDNIFVTGSADKTIKIWQGFQCIRTINGHDNWVRCLTSIDGNTFASGSEDRKLKIWNLEGECLNVYPDHKSPITCMVYLPDRKMIASGSSGMRGSNIKIWTVDNAITFQTLPGHGRGLRCLGYIQTSGTLVSGGGDHLIKVWNLKLGTCLKSIRGMSSITCISIFSDTKVLCGGDYDIKCWDLSKDRCIWTFFGHKDWVWKVATLKNIANCFVSSSVDSTIKIWNVDIGKCICSLEYHDTGVYSVSELKNGWIISGSRDGSINIYGNE